MMGALFYSILRDLFPPVPNFHDGWKRQNRGLLESGNIMIFAYSSWVRERAGSTEKDIRKTPEYDSEIPVIFWTFPGKMIFVFRHAKVFRQDPARRADRPDTDALYIHNKMCYNLS